MSQVLKMRDTVNNGYFESLSQKTKDIVKELILKHAENRNGPDGYKSDTECLEDIECHSRDGFIAFSHNKGGLDYNNFCTLSDYNSGGYVPASPKAAKEIESSIDYGLKYAIESTFKDNQELCEKLGLTQETLSYHAIDQLTGLDAETKKLAERLQDDLCNTESDFLNDNDSTIMHQLRFFYHGKDEKGLHQASVCCTINCEGPYHRAGRNEGCKEIEIQWRNNAELKRKLDKALAKASKAVF